MYGSSEHVRSDNIEKNLLLINLRQSMIIEKKLLTRRNSTMHREWLLKIENECCTHLLLVTMRLQYFLRQICLIYCVKTYLDAFVEIKKLSVDINYKKLITLVKLFVVTW